MTGDFGFGVVDAVVFRMLSVRQAPCAPQPLLPGHHHGISVTSLTELSLGATGEVSVKL